MVQKVRRSRDHLGRARAGRRHESGNLRQRFGRQGHPRKRQWRRSLPRERVGATESLEVSGGLNAPAVESVAAEGGWVQRPHLVEASRRQGVPAACAARHTPRSVWQQHVQAASGPQGESESGAQDCPAELVRREVGERGLRPQLRHEPRLQPEAGRRHLLCTAELPPLPAPTPDRVRGAWTAWSRQGAHRHSGG